VLVIALSSVAVPGTAVSTEVPDGAWFIDGSGAAIQIFDCSGRLCGLTPLQGLQPTGLDHWNSGWLYNPDDGETYRVSAEHRSADVFVARIYLGVPVFGETKTLLRVPQLRSEGRC